MKRIIIIMGALCTYFFSTMVLATIAASGVWNDPGWGPNHASLQECMSVHSAGQPCGPFIVGPMSFNGVFPGMSYRFGVCPDGNVTASCFMVDINTNPCPSNSTRSGATCVCDSGYNENAGACTAINQCAAYEGQSVGGIVACMDQTSLCNSNAGPSGGCAMSLSPVSGGGDVGIMLKGDTCFKSNYLATYSGSQCTQGQTVHDGTLSIVTPTKPIEDSNTAFCVDGVCIQKKACGEEDKQVCTETTTGGLLCYTQGKCSNTQAPSVPIGPYTVGQSELKGKCKVTGLNLDQYCYDQSTKTNPTGGNGGSSSAYVDPSSIASPGLYTGGSVSGGEIGGGGTTEQGKYCDEHPQALACAKMDNPTDTESLQTQTVNITFQKEMTAGGQCPAPQQFTALGRTYEIKYDAICTFAESCRPFVIILSNLFATIWIFSVYTKVT